MKTQFDKDITEEEFIEGYKEYLKSRISYLENCKKGKRDMRERSIYLMQGTLKSDECLKKLYLHHKQMFLGYGHTYFSNFIILNFPADYSK